MSFRKSVGMGLLSWFLSAGHFLAAQNLSHWEKVITAFEQEDQVSKPPRKPIVFTGSSSIQLWETLAQDFPNKKVLNRGFGGSQTFEVLQLADRIILPYRPRQVVIYVGDNDLAAGKTSAQIFTDFKALYTKIRQGRPKTHVTFISIKPSPSRKHLLPAIVQTNQLIRDFLQMQRRTGYVDVYQLMLTPLGKFNPALYQADSLHMTEAGYRIWAAAVRPALK